MNSGVDQAGVDGRSVGELLLDADLAARAALWDLDPDGAKARVRSWGEVVEAAVDLWAAIPDSSRDSGIRPIAGIAEALHRTHRRSGWPGSGPSDMHLESVAVALSRAADLVRGRRDPAAPLAGPAQLDAEAARTRLMHVVYVSTHALSVVLDRYTARLQRLLDARHALPFGESVHHARGTQARVCAVERLAGAYLQVRWPTALAGEHRVTSHLERLDQALARWDLQAHRSLAAPPTTAALALVIRVQQDIVVATAIIGAAAASQGLLNDQDVDRVAPALAELDRAWGALGATLAPLVARQRRIDDDLLLAGAEVQAALREITHRHAGLAPPAVMAAGVDLTAAARHLHHSLTAGVDLAHVVGDALRDPELTVSARGAHALSVTSGAQAGDAAWVDAGAFHYNRDVAAPDPVRDALMGRADQVITGAITADSAATSLQPTRQVTSAMIATGRAHQDRAVRGTPQQEAAPRWGCER